MKTPILQVILGTAAVFIAGCDATSHHRRMHQAHQRLAQPHGHVHSRAESNVLVKRGTCAFPTDDPNLVAVTPDQKNAGWAMSPDQECKPGNYCPIACKPGMVMNQWDPDSTYTYPASMNGGLYCDKNGNVKKPFPDKPNCVEGTGSVKAINKCKSHMSWCQTVLPGNEAMLIPTLVNSEATIAVPGSSYWQSTAAHFYINPPGTGTDGCIWGTEDKPIGNWSPYVAGANTDSNGQTFVKVGWNPIWESSSLKGTKPGFGVKIECPDGGCSGLPCQIDPSAAEGSVASKNAAVGAGGSAFCVVTVAKGSSAHIVAFDASGGNKETPKESSSAPPPPPPSTSQQPTTSQIPTTTSTLPKPTTTSVAPTTTSQPTTTLVPTSSSTLTPSSSSTTTTTTTTSSSSSTTSPPTTTTTTTTSSSSSSTTSYALPTLIPGIFHENGTSSSNTTTTFVSSTAPTTFIAETTVPNAPKPTEKKGEAGRQQGSAAVAGLVVALVAAACLF
ncbi:SUN domain protein (Adg3), putative [Metarhizium acridum CQMa 102]|uniref:SUN domain protein (Adg3), putative n=1 Tax=Metarhizium acridum (strain CQMa 102) TaxID=655827 RepID=E9DST2_METAQ|nr:SUN domain protein (Adg3), putative [Metarhizium acridum CQMa 102]EFY93442.1 SUN domain protein (Adg3), putative [Metarhizium acridum CQMa 102]